jgi:hypothetical protein
MGRRKPENSTPQKNNSIKDLVGNEQNEYPVPDTKRTIINITNELNGTQQKHLLKRKLWTRSLRISWNSYKTWLNRKCNLHSRNIKTPQIKYFRRHRNN